MQINRKKPTWLLVHKFKHYFTTSSRLLQLQSAKHLLNTAYQALPDAFATYGNWAMKLLQLAKSTQSLGSAMFATLTLKKGSGLRPPLQSYTIPPIINTIQAMQMFIKTKFCEIFISTLETSSLNPSFVYHSGISRGFDLTFGRLWLCASVISKNEKS